MKCKDLAKELGITPMHVGRLRKKIAPHETDELSDDTCRAIRLIIADVEEVAEQEVAPAITSERVRARVMSKGHGRFVLCGIYATSKRVVAMMPTGTPLDHLIGQDIWLEEIEFNNENYYRHISLANRTFEPATYKR
jgi:hypothetical protein